MKHNVIFSNKKVDLYYHELKNWVSFNEKKLLKEKFKLNNIKYLLLKLKLKATLRYLKIY